MPAAAEWHLRPSRLQHRLNLVLAGTLCVFTAVVSPLFLPLPALLLLWFFPMRHGPVQRIGVDPQGWWLDKGQGREYVSWGVGSIRRRHLVVLNWSWLPWHSLVVRVDSLNSADDFRRLKAALYQSWH